MPPHDSDSEVKAGDVVTISNAYINRSVMDHTICGVNELSWEDVLNHRLPTTLGVKNIHSMCGGVRRVGAGVESINFRPLASVWSVV